MVESKINQLILFLQKRKQNGSCKVEINKVIDRAIATYLRYKSEGA